MGGQSNLNHSRPVSGLEVVAIGLLLEMCAYRFSGASVEKEPIEQHVRTVSATRISLSFQGAARVTNAVRAGMTEEP